jgi:uncharacterized damage-inducible protein DinB
VAVKNGVAGVTAEQAAWKTDGMDNSIWEIIRHLNYYNFAYLERFKGIDYEYGISDNAESFDIEGGATEVGWAAEINRFDSIMTEWRELLESADESKFDYPVLATRKDPWGEIIAHINIHNAHHAGQVVLIRKLQGSWDSQKGVS